MTPPAVHAPAIIVLFNSAISCSAGQHHCNTYKNKILISLVGIVESLLGTVVVTVASERKEITLYCKVLVRGLDLEKETVTLV